MNDWATTIGQGPARATCLEAVQAFQRGVEHVQRGDLAAWCKAPCGTFEAEGIGAGCVLHGLDRPEVPRLQVLIELGAGVGFAIQRLHGDTPALTTANEADGYGFGSMLLRPDATLSRRSRHIDAGWLDAFEHGCGRAMWYLAAGDARQLVRLARGRGASTWRGIGAASVFTGGADLESLRAAAVEQEALEAGIQAVQHAMRRQGW